MYLIFDTETTGKPKNYAGKMHDLDNWPRVTQIAWALFKEDGSLHSKEAHIIKPDGWEVPKEEFFIKNNMSTERCEKEGKPISEVLYRFIFNTQLSNYLIAHNINFDYNVLGAEMIRAKKSTGKKMIQVCTMQSTIDYCQLPGKYGFKFPQLAELHKKLFDCDFDGAHDAMNDVLACAKCFFELKKREIIKL